MIKSFTFAFFFFITFLNSYGQSVVTELNGFQLGQFREAPTNEFGKPSQQDKYEDGYEYEVFKLVKDKGVYMVFEYAASSLDVIWSIQISGDNPSKNIGFKGLKLGMDKDSVIKILGKPSEIENIGEYGEKWNYNDSNYSIEISTKDKLSSVKILDNYSGKTPDLTKIPKFTNIAKILNSKNNAEIASILAPGLEIYFKDKVLFFEKSIKTEIDTDASKIFETIRELSKSFDKINISDQNVYEENMRFEKEKTSKHVIKIKNASQVKEIVFDYINGKYLIWEIKTK